MEVCGRPTVVESLSRAIMGALDLDPVTTQLTEVSVEVSEDGVTVRASFRRLAGLMGLERLGLSAGDPIDVEAKRIERDWAVASEMLG